MLENEKYKSIFCFLILSLLLLKVTSYAIATKTGDDVDQKTNSKTIKIDLVDTAQMNNNSTANKSESREEEIITTRTIPATAKGMSATPSTTTISTTTTTTKTTTKTTAKIGPEKRFCMFAPSCTMMEKQAEKCGCFEDNVQQVKFWGYCFCYQQPPSIAMP